MVQAYDHRAANIVVNLENRHRPAQPVPATLEQHENADWLPDPQFWVAHSQIPAEDFEWWIGWKDVTAPTNVRTVIASIIPQSGVGNTFPVLLPLENPDAYAMVGSLLLANLNAIPFDYVARQKVQGQHLNWYIIEQLPVVPPDQYESTHFGPKTAAEIVRDAVLELTYTAHDMAPFARDLSYDGPPFQWDENRRLHLRAKLDALFFHLYGITDRDDIRYIYSTFPIVERQETATYDRYLSRDLCLAWVNALAAGDQDAEISL